MENQKEEFVVTAALLDKWGACKSGISRFVRACPSGSATIQEVIAWADENGWNGDARWIMDAFCRHGDELPAGVTSIGYINLGSYAHPLPAGVTSIGDINLGSYAHPLPAGVTSIGYINLGSYAHPLPAGVTGKKKVAV